MTMRSIIAGGILSLLLAVIIPLNDWVFTNTQLINAYLPPAVTIGMLLFILVINPLLGKRFRFTRPELVVIAMMLLCLSGVASRGLSLAFAPTVTASASFLSKDSREAGLRIPLTVDQIDAQKQRRQTEVDQTIARSDQDGDSRLSMAEFWDTDAQFALIDANNDARIDAAELDAHYQKVHPHWLSTWRYAVPIDLSLAIPESGPIRTEDPLYKQYVEDFYMGIDRGWDSRVHHRSVVTWTNADGQAQTAIALGGMERDTALAAGRTDFLDLEQGLGRKLFGASVLDKIETKTGIITINAIQPAQVPVGSWLLILLAWAPLLIGFFVAVIALAGVVRHQWINNERLAYPIAQVYADLTQEPKGHSKLPPALCQPGFWAAAGLVLLIHLWRGAHFYGLMPIDFTVQWKMWGAFISGEPWSHMLHPAAVFSPRLHFSILAMAFFMTREVSFSLWFWFIGLNLVVMWLNISGTPISIDHADYASTGGMAVMCMLILWLGRHYYWALAKALVRRRYASPEVRAAVPYVWALAGGVALMLVFMLLHGVAFFHAALMVLLVLGVMLVLARIIAESGAPMIQLAHSVMPNFLLTGVFGISGAAAALVPLAMVGNMLTLDSRECLMPYVVNADHLGDKAKLSPHRVSMLLLITVAVGGALAVMSLAIGSYFEPNKGGINWARGQLQHNLVAISDTGSQDNSDAGAAILFGAVLVAIIGIARTNISGLALHPIGILMWSSHATRIIWFSFFIGWLAKCVTLRYGGTRVYRRLQPVAIGIICGEAVAIFLFMSIKIIATVLGYEIPAFRVM